VRVDELMGVLVQREAEDHDVGRLEKAVESVERRDAVQGFPLAVRHPPRAGDDVSAGAERTERLPGAATDVPEADEPDRRALQRLELRALGLVDGRRPASF